MACVQFGEAVVCGVNEPLACRRLIYCPVCERRRRFVQVWGGVWYSDTLQCVACGDSWSDGELHERPFARGWRKKAIAKARHLYYTVAVDPRTYRRDVTAIFVAEMDEYARMRREGVPA